MIPKIVWQTHECEYNELPELYRSNSQTWINGFSDWKYVYHTRNDRYSFVKKYFPEYIKIYSHIIPGIYQADFWRYLVLYKFGGLYADMDSIYTGESLTFNKGLTISTNTIGFPEDTPYQNAWIASDAKNETLKKVIDELIYRTDFYNLLKMPDPGPMWVFATGPAMLSFIIKQNKKDVNFLFFPVEHAGKYKHESDFTN